MKTYEEMARSALVRGKAIRKQRKKTERVVLGGASGLLVCCLMIWLVSGMWKSDSNHTQPEAPLNYGTVSYLSVSQKTNPGVLGQTFQYIAGTSSPAAGAMSSSSPPDFQFLYGYIHVVARAVEEYPDVYETLNEYGSTRTSQYRLFRMEVIDPLQSGMEGEFFYLLPAKLKGDLTQYDALLISMTQLPVNYVLRCGDRLTAYPYLFTDPAGSPELGNIIAFTDDVFDESLWQDSSWLYGYQFAKYKLDQADEDLLVFRGSTLTEALQRRQAQIDEWGEWAKYVQVRTYAFQTEAAQAAMAYLEPFVNGVFVPVRNSSNYTCRRYINGCPTNEWISIGRQDETVTTSQYRFEDADFENLPNITQYIASMDLSQLAPQHTDPAGKTLIYNSAVGWYEKTESGVYSIVRIAWRYFDQEDPYTEYYDETFILLDETGDHVISRETLLEKIGENSNISGEQYGVGIPMPMC